MDSKGFTSFEVSVGVIDCGGSQWASFCTFDSCIVGIQPEVDAMRKHMLFSNAGNNGFVLSLSAAADFPVVQ